MPPESNFYDPLLMNETVDSNVPAAPGLSKKKEKKTSKYVQMQKLVRQRNRSVISDYESKHP